MSKDKYTPWQRFVSLLEFERKDILQVFYYASFSGLVALSLPLGIQAIINLIQGAQISSSWIVLVSLVTLGVVFVGILDLMQLRIIETIQQRIFTNISFEMTYRFPRLKAETIRNNYPPELANRFFDTITIQKGLSKVLIDLPASILQVVLSLILLSFYHPLFIIFGIVMITTLYFVFQYTAKKGLRTSIVESKYKYMVAHWIQEVARSIISFKLSGSADLALEKNNSLTEKYLHAREGHFSIIRFQYIKMIAFKAITTCGLLVIGGLLVLNQQINIGQFVASEIIILLVISSIEKLIRGLETLYDMLTSIEKLGLVLDKSIESSKGEKIDLSNGIHIELEKVSYEVPNRQKPILDNITLNINPNSKILIQGKSGSGKSTFLRILAGVNEITSGNIYINELSISGINTNHFRSFLGLSLIEEYPFEGTLRENLTFGLKGISDKEMIDTINDVGLSSFLKGLPRGLDTLVYPEGRQISLTAAKKIVLARAILKKPKLLILEDALGQFCESETKSIIDMLCNSSNPWAIIVVSSNEYWKKYCTEIITMKNGRIDQKIENKC